MTGRLYGIGLGPGDPELMTLKAARILQQTNIISYFCKTPKTGHAYTIFSDAIKEKCEEMPLVYPITTEYPVDDPRYETLIHNFYEESAEQLAKRLSGGEDVGLIAVGDPFFYGSFMHIYHRLHERFECVVIPGVTSMTGCWANAKSPMTWGDDVLTILPGTMNKSTLTQRLQSTDAAVIMKLGKHFSDVRQALQNAGMIERAIYIEYGTMANERIVPMMKKTDDHAPYFSLIIVPGKGRRL